MRMADDAKHEQAAALLRNGLSNRAIAAECHMHHQSVQNLRRQMGLLDAAFERRRATGMRDPAMLAAVGEREEQMRDMYLAGRRYEEIAVALSISPPTISHTLARMRQRAIDARPEVVVPGALRVDAWCAIAERPRLPPLGRAHHKWTLVPDAPMSDVDALALADAGRAVVATRHEADRVVLLAKAP